MTVGRILPIALLAVVVLTASGCGSGQATVNGSVTLDGAPLEKGDINFIPADGQGGTAGGAIKDGKYSVSKVPPGSKIVQITASKKVGEHKAYPDDPNSPMLDDVKDIIPAEYNTKSTLKADLTAGSNELKPFELKSK
jgi:hypothetical protein